MYKRYIRSPSETRSIKSEDDSPHKRRYISPTKKFRITTQFDENGLRPETMQSLNSVKDRAQAEEAKNLIDESYQIEDNINK